MCVYIGKPQRFGVSTFNFEHLPAACIQITLPTRFWWILACAEFHGAELKPKVTATVLSVQAQVYRELQELILLRQSKVQRN